MCLCLKGRTIRYLGGGGLEYLLLANFFFTSERKQSFFLAINVRQLFCLCFVEEIFCCMLSLSCTLPFGVFSGQHIFHQFRKKLFFSAHIFNKLFFSDFCGDKLFFSSPPPPQISNGASLRGVSFTILYLYILVTQNNLSVCLSVYQQT